VDATKADAGPMAIAEVGCGKSTFPLAEVLPNIPLKPQAPETLSSPFFPQIKIHIFTCVHMIIRLMQ